MFFEDAICRENTESFQEIARQSGKTTAVVESVAYLMGVLDLVLGRPVGVGFFAPRYEQAKTDWDRVKDIMPEIAVLFGLKTVEDNAHTMRYRRPLYARRSGRFLRWENASVMYAMSLGESTKLESKTLDIAIVEEAHEISDKKFKKEVRPMLTATNGIACFIGVAGYQMCDFKRGVEESGRTLIFPVDKVIESRREAFEETGDHQHLEYEKFYKKTLEKVGNVITDEIKTQYLLEWVTERGNFVTRKQLESCRKRFFCVETPDVMVGIDWGKHTDPTVVTVSTELGQRLRSKEYLGTDYVLQVPLIIKWLQEEFADKGWNIRKIIYDSTGGGDVVGETLKEKSRWSVEPFVFSQISKANLYQTFGNLIALGAAIASDPSLDKGQRRFEYWEYDEMVGKFEYEMCDLVKEYKGDKQLLSVHHPDESGAHDDYPDSAAMSVSYERKPLTFMTL